jgi:3-deoxy-7-phosphoheptulonate synthase
MWVPTATEFLDPLSVGYISDLISWGAIGARTTESQTHRELASWLSCPIGFKNGTDGSTKIAADAMQSTKSEHTLLSVWGDGKIAIIKTTGNPDTHIILRWSNKGTNYDQDSISEASKLAQKYGLPSRIMIDVSHQNSQKDHKKQMDGIDAIAVQIATGSRDILGVMIESNLIEWAQAYIPGKGNGDVIIYGQSITDGCVDIPTTYSMLQKLAHARR